MAKDKKNYVEAKTLKGFRDVLPPESLIKSCMVTQLEKVFLSFGYVPLETPHIEYLESLIGETKGDIEKQLYTFKDQGDRDVCLRFDLTVPFARSYVQNRRELGTPFKRYAIGNVFRGERPQLGRYREFTQCDFDFIGTDSLIADVEVVQVVKESLIELGIHDFTIRVNHRRLMNGLAKLIGVEEQSSDLLRILDKADKIGVEEVIKLLKSELKLGDSEIATLTDFISISDHFQGKDLFEKISEYKSKNELLDQGISELEEFFNLLNPNIDNVKIDFSVARGLGYYTGIIYEAIVNSAKEIGTVCAGGRYDKLTNNFSNEDLPGVGASVGIDRLLKVIEKLEIDLCSTAYADVLMTLLDKKHYQYISYIASEVRRAGISVEIYPDTSKLKKQLQYADKRKHQFVIVTGDKEIEQNIINLKVMDTGEQIKFDSIEKLIEFFEV